MMKCDVLITGVGGQGQILASRLIGAAAIIENQPVRTGETIGMSQRGGCVVSHVRIGGESKSATIPFGYADLIIGFELCETVRSLNRLSPDGGLIVNKQTINPVTVSLGMEAYDTEAMEKALQAKTDKRLIVDGYGLAQQAGSVKAVNVVLLGAAVGSGFLKLSRESFIEAIKSTVSQKFHELNVKAFELGYGFANMAMK
ncbi:MAG: indolepyruvate oxidoreductase subunit beta [Clostridia bacterium]|nr:indolepyruvate oxidoreductase subunit beta [Clostridia bacterium]